MQQAASRYANDWNESIDSKSELSVRQVTKTTKMVNQHRKIMVKCGLGFFIYAVLLVFMCTKSASLGYEIEGLNKDIQKLETENNRLEYQISQKSSLSRVEQIATSQLGMQKVDLQNSIAMEMEAQPVTVAAKENKNVNNAISQKPLYKIYTSLSHLAQNSL